VDLVFPRTGKQILQLAKEVLPSISSNGVVEELKITGFCSDPVVDLGDGPELDKVQLFSYFCDRRPPKTISSRVIEAIKASCPRLKTLIIRNCGLDLEMDVELNLPNTLQKLEFHSCRYRN
jgi:hypothetical protein